MSRHGGRTWGRSAHARPRAAAIDELQSHALLMRTVGARPRAGPALAAGRGAATRALREVPPLVDGGVSGCHSPGRGDPFLSTWSKTGDQHRAKRVISIERNTQLHSRATTPMSDRWSPATALRSVTGLHQGLEQQLPALRSEPERRRQQLRRDEPAVVAHDALHHGARHPAAIVLPVLPISAC